MVIAEKPPQHHILFAILLGVAGLAGNYCRYSFFFNVDYLFGSIFTMIAIQLLGWRLGTLSGFLAATSTFALWGHPYAILTFTCEAAVTGAIFCWRRKNLLLANFTFWLVLGIPLVLLFSSAILHMAPGEAATLALKQSLNGITNTLLARLALPLALQLRGKSLRLPMSYQETLLSLFAAFTLVPALIFLSIYNRHEMVKIDEELTMSLTNVVRQTTPLLQRWFDENIIILATLNQQRQDPSPLQQRLAAVKETDPDFLSIALLDERSRLIAALPERDEHGRLLVGVDFSDRPYLAQLQRQQKPMVTSFIDRKVGTLQPTMLLLVPNVVNGRFAGYVAAVIDLRQIYALLSSITQSWHVNFSLTDRADRVIVSNQPGPKTTSPPLAKGNGIAIRLPATEPTVNRWTKAVYSTSVRLPFPEGWNLTLEAPVAPHKARLMAGYRLGLLMVMGIAVPGLWLAAWLSRHFLNPLASLGAISANLPERISAREAVVWPDSLVPEINKLIGNYQAMEASLQLKFQELAASIADLELEREERRSLEERLTSLRETLEKEERIRISRELHDSIGQSLAAIKLSLQLFLAQGKLAPPDASQMQKAIADLSRTNAELRNIVYSFRPAFFDKMSFCETVYWCCERFRHENSAIEMHLDCVPVQLSDRAKYHLFRILQEVLTNVAKHAEATAVQLTINVTAGRLYLEGWDDGRGGVVWPAANDGLPPGSGLAIMQERAELLGGRFAVDSPVGKGTTILVEVPAQ
jgi:two-component system, cell cycle sensor histidine kinase and response regulator CckA